MGEDGGRESGAIKTSIPVIDMKDFPAQSKKLIEACQDLGCFRIANFHEILQKSLMQEMKSVARKMLLELPAEVKARNKAVIPGSGYMAPSQINPLYEAFGVYDMSRPQDVDSFCNDLSLDSHQRDTILKYASAVNTLMMEISDKICRGLGLINNGGSSRPSKDWPCQFRINKYSFTSENIGSQGVQLHTDSSFLTVLHDDDVIGGLEVMSRSGEFLAVDPCPGTLLVNLGDIATVWSNGRFLNVKHRVMCKEIGIRVSIASFLLGPKWGFVEAPKELVDNEEEDGTHRPRLFVPFTYEDFRKIRVSKDLRVGEALDLFRLDHCD